MRRILTALIVCALAWLAVPAVAAQAGETPGQRALDWAEQNTYWNGPHWYCWGGSGPSCYDCSGLVMEAAGHADGIWLPHNAAEMTQNWHLYRIPLASAQRGDLLTWGWPAYHIEFDTIWPHASFGAHHSGTAIGWASYAYFWPSAAWRLR